MDRFEQKEEQAMTGTIEDFGTDLCALKNHDSKLIYVVRLAQTVRDVSERFCNRE